MTLIKNRQNNANTWTVSIKVRSAKTFGAKALDALHALPADLAARTERFTSAQALGILSASSAPSSTSVMSVSHFGGRSCPSP